MGKKTLCKWDKEDLKERFKEYKKLVRAASFICRKCGRAAVDEDLLCKPEKLKKDDD